MKRQDGHLQMLFEFRRTGREREREREREKAGVKKKRRMTNSIIDKR